MISLKNNLVMKLIDRLYEVLHSKSNIESFHVISQVSYLLLIKRENADVWEYIKTGNRSEQILHEIQNKLLPEIQRQLVSLYNISHIDNIEFKIKNMEILHECIDVIDSIYKEIYNRNRITESISCYDIDGLIFDELYEKAIKRFGKTQNLYIPRHIRNMMAALTQANNSAHIYDPMCGSGGLLLSAYEKIMVKEYGNKRGNYINIDDDGFSMLTYSSMKDLPSLPMLSGADSNMNQILLTALNFQLRGIQRANLQPDNFIENNIPNNFDVIIANPPFGQTLNIPYRNHEITTKNAEIAFIDRITSSLVSKGKATIIVSEGFLTKTNQQFVGCRKRLLTQNKLEAVISLPPGIFYNTQAKSSLLILTKDEDYEDRLSRVWFYELLSDGYTNDNIKRRTKEYPLPEAVEAFNQRKNDIRNARTEKSFFVSLEEIQENDWNLSYNRYKQFSYEKQDFGDSDEIMYELLSNEKEIQSTLDELKSTLIWRQ